MHPMASFTTRSLENRVSKPVGPKSFRVGALFPGFHGSRSHFQDFFIAPGGTCQAAHAHDCLGIRIFPPGAAAEIAIVHSGGNGCKLQVILEKIPTHDGIILSIIPGNDTGFRRPDDAQGDYRIAFCQV